MEIDRRTIRKAKFDNPSVSTARKKDMAVNRADISLVKHGAVAHDASGAAVPTARKRQLL